VTQRLHHVSRARYVRATCILLYGPGSLLPKMWINSLSDT